MRNICVEFNLSTLTRFTMKKVFLTLLVSLLPALMAAQTVQTAKGYVFEDRNGNGRRDRGEKGIPGVSVTNGRGTVAVTDGKGYYELPVGNDNIVAVIKPAHYALPLDRFNRPQYYYIHKPYGSPEGLAYKGVAPTGALPRSIDFPLVPSPEPEEFKAVVLGDPQIINMITLDYFDRKIVSDLKKEKEAAFALTLGDVVNNDLSLMEPYKETVAGVGLPWYDIYGNHDTNYTVDVDSLATETFLATLGPADYAFNYANAHFLCLDNILWPDPRQTRKRIWGGLRQDQRDFIQNDLRLVPADKLVVVSAHIPFVDGWVRPSDIRFLFLQLSRFDNVLLLTAHTHVQQQFFYGEQQGWFGSRPLHEYNVGTSCGSWYSGFFDGDGLPEMIMSDGTPPGYALLNVSGNKYTLDYKVAGQPRDYQMNIIHPKVMMEGSYGPSYITVNYFMGDKDDRVEYRIDGGKWIEMKHTLRTDPEYEFMYLTWERLDGSKPNHWPAYPTPCKHLWQAPIPCKGHPAGIYEIEVRATNRYGHVHTGKSSYEIAPVTIPNIYP